MFKIFLDTNVAFDLIANREPFIYNSFPLLELVERGEAQLFVSEVSLGTLIYLAEKYKLPEAKVKLVNFVLMCGVISGGKEAFFGSMDSNFLDKEDGLQYSIALKNKMDFLLTRNKKDFKSADGKIQILSPKEFFESR